ncbi:MAG: hypothetical protein HZA46_06385 [Planctomycetales bacterium]|nr:hypothetical protein [Planctomycetales bacterium]
MSHLNRVLLAIVMVLPIARPAAAQMITTQTPFQNNSASFFESTSVGWSLNGPGYFARFGNPGLSRPPFGGYVPGAGLTTGFQTNGGGFSSNFLFDFSQGSSYSSVSTTPVLTTTNGYPGFLAVGQQQNFVTGVVPVVGNGGGFFYVPSTAWYPTGYFNGFNPGYGPAMTPVGSPWSVAGRYQRGEYAIQDGRVVVPGGRAADRLNDDVNPPPPPREFSRQGGTSAESARQHLIERRAVELATASSATSGRSKASTPPRTESQLNRETALRYFDRARQAESDGKSSTALIYYRLAAKHADAELLGEVDAALRRVESK